MKHQLIAAALLVLPSLASAAPPDSTTAPAGRANSLRAGAWALQFDINGQLFDVSEFAGGVSLKRQFSDKSAIRLGVGVSGATQDRDYSRNPGATIDSNGYALSLESLFQRYANPAAATNFYWGLGPYIYFDHASAEQSADSVSRTSETERVDVGLRAMMGVEWFASREISLHVEYTGTGGYYRRTDTTEYSRVGQPTDRATMEDKGWSVGATGLVRFGLSVYF